MHEAYRLIGSATLRLQNPPEGDAETVEKAV
jgi:hypothetical protein